MWLPDCSEGLEDRPNHLTIHFKGQALETMRGLALALMRHWTQHWRRSRRTREVSAGWTSITRNSRRPPVGSARARLNVRSTEKAPHCFPNVLPGKRGGHGPGAFSSKHKISLAKFGAGEGIRTLD